MIKNGMMIRRAIQAIAEEMRKYNFAINVGYGSGEQEKEFVNRTRRTLEFVTDISTWFRVSDETKAFEYLIVQYRIDKRVIMYVKNIESYEHYTLVEKYVHDYEDEIERLQKMYGDENVIEVI